MRIYKCRVCGYKCKESECIPRDGRLTCGDAFCGANVGLVKPKQMDPKEQNKELAKLDGWTEGHVVHWTEGHSKFYEWGWTPPNPTFGFPGKCSPPDYLNDLNAVRGILNALKKKYRAVSVHNVYRDYMAILVEITNPDAIMWDNGKYLGTFNALYNVEEASAEQKCEAILKATGKWVVEEKV